MTWQRVSLTNNRDLKLVYFLIYLSELQSKINVFKY